MGIISKRISENIRNPLIPSDYEYRDWFVDSCGKLVTTYYKTKTAHNGYVQRWSRLSNSWVSNWN